MVLSEPSLAAKRRLIWITEVDIQALKLSNSGSIQAREPKLLPNSASIVYEAPVAQPIREVEITLEVMTKVCKAHVSVAVRTALIEPDEERPELDVPDFVLKVRASGCWEPSKLQESPPESYHASTHLAPPLQCFQDVQSCGTPADDHVITEL